MGADLVGYHVILPKEFTKEELIQLNNHLDKLDKFIDTPNLIETILNENTSGKNTKKFYEMLPILADEMDCQGWELEEVAFELKSIKELIPEIRKRITNFNWDHRDVDCRIIKILNRDFSMIFAGEQTWGDAPEGSGYSYLLELDRVGILIVMENISNQHYNISNSIEFIRGED